MDDPTAPLYIVHASDGSNGTFDGIWLEDAKTNQAVAGSEKSWADVGITNWENQSTDIWSDKVYTYKFGAGNGTPLSFEFSLINETSKDSVIDALEGVELYFGTISVSNSENLTLDNATYTKVVSGEVGNGWLNLSLEDEYGLGRDYSDSTDGFNEQDLSYDATNKVFKVIHTNTRDGVQTQKTYSDYDTTTDKIVKSIRSQIKTNLGNYLDVVKARVLAGATDPTNINLSSLVGNGNMTGDGSITYLEETVTINPTGGSWLSTWNQDGAFASASINFSGLGTSYNLADLIGMGFNSTCHTCDNHYSIEFTTKDITNTSWRTAKTSDGKEYNYSSVKQGQNYTLYIDLDSLKDSGITDGVEFSNAVCEIAKTSNFGFHFSQYATGNNDATLYIFDNRDYLVENGTSVATEASFSPYSYNTENVAIMEIPMFDEDTQNYAFSLKYEYDYSDIFDASKIKYEYELADDGKYIINDVGDYEEYDPTNPNHVDKDRYNLKDVTYDLNGQDFDLFLDNYIYNTMFDDIAKASTLFINSRYAKYEMAGTENDNKASITLYDTPYQIYEDKLKKKDYTNLRIQCSSNANDFINIKRQKLSVGIMGLNRLDVSTVRGAMSAAGKASNALKKVSAIRSRFGAYQNRLEHAYSINQNTAENTQSAESIIRDTDMATEMVRYSNQNIIAQASQSMLAQANQLNNYVLNLLG